MSDADSPQVKLVRSYIQGYEKRDVGHVAKHLHKDARRVTYPRSLSLPEENREEWLRRLTELAGLCTDSEASILCVATRFSLPLA